MTFKETIEYLYAKLPMFQRIGEKAYKKDLHNTLALCEYVGNPHLQFKSVHIAGTNGKGSSSHLIASILQSAGYKTGLYTSPHLKSFTERIKVNGEEVEQEFIIKFVENMQPAIATIEPSFFELTTVMAFAYFAQKQVDIAVIETGLGGRLDSTNVISPEVSLITNISYDHQNILGNTLQEIAFEKAGIIKNHVPCVISELQEEVKNVFKTKAMQTQSPIFFASEEYQINSYYFDNQLTSYEEADFFNIIKKTDEEEETVFLSHLTCPLKGGYQEKNLCGVIKTIELLKNHQISKEHIRNGIEKVVSLTGLKGRWQILNEKPLTICDTGHNEAGIRQVVKQLKKLHYEHLHIVFGVVNDKDLSKILAILPTEAYYYFCKPNIMRGLDAFILQQQAATYGLQGEVIPEVLTAYHAAQRKARENDVIFIGGSTFVVAEALE
ncbi:MAG: folylpolyglutamate synthase/dihydrofolate synthase family protein [Thermoflexibacter sp.]